jgi:hypothetical protein
MLVHTLLPVLCGELRIRGVLQTQLTTWPGHGRKRPIADIEQLGVSGSSRCS